MKMPSVSQYHKYHDQLGDGNVMPTELGTDEQWNWNVWQCNKQGFWDTETLIGSSKLVSEDVVYVLSSPKNSFWYPGFIVVTKHLYPSHSRNSIIVCTPPLSIGTGVEPPTKFSKEGGLTGCQFWEGGCLERESDFFHRGEDCSFYIKKKIWNIYWQKKI